MRELITDEMVETAARAAYNSGSSGYDLWAHLTSYEEESYLKEARAALEAAVPLIAATALQPIRDALANHPRCEEHPDGDVISCGWKTAVMDELRGILMDLLAREATDDMFEQLDLQVQEENDD